LGLSFVLKSPEYESVPQMAVARPVNPAGAKKLEGSFASIPSDRQPLKPWEKYAPARLQASEAIFVS
jgi:hypothetical protein